MSTIMEKHYVEFLRIVCGRVYNGLSARGKAELKKELPVAEFEKTLKSAEEVARMGFDQCIHKLDVQTDGQLKALERSEAQSKAFVRAAVDYSVFKIG